MAKATPPADPTSVATLERLDPVEVKSDAKGSINLRIDAKARELIDDAAALLGKTRTEFMVEAARRAAIDVVLDQRLFSLDPTHYDAFVQALDKSPAPGAKLKALLKRRPAWET